MRDKKAQLYKAIKNLNDEDSLERILHFVKEETAVYGNKKSLSWEDLPQWQKDAIDLGSKEADNGEGVTLEEFKNRLKTL